MTDAVPAFVVLAALATLSVDLRAAVVLDAAGSVIAGDPVLSGAARSLLEGAAERDARQMSQDGGRLYAARSQTHSVALAVGPYALEALVVHDLLTALDDLRGC